MLFLLGKRWNYEKGIMQFWNSWIFLSQNFSLCLPCICCLTLRRIKQFSNVFVPKMSLKNAHFVWKMGFGWFILSTTVYPCSQLFLDTCAFILQIHNFQRVITGKGIKKMLLFLKFRQSSEGEKYKGFFCFK